MMQEWCSCGASIKARRKDVEAWRSAHACPDKKSDPDKMGANAQVERASRRDYEHGEYLWSHAVPVIQSRIGFQPNPPADAIQ